MPSTTSATAAIDGQPGEPAPLLHELCHELRAPVAAIAALAALVAGSDVAEADRAAASLLLAEHAQHLAAVLEGVSDVVGAPRPRPVARDDTPVWLPGLVLAAADAVGLPAPRLRVEVEPAVRHVSCDRVALRQVLTNLLDNATRHGHGAPVDVTARRTQVALVVAVSDRGPGLCGRERRRLLEGRGATAPTGWGIGWSVVRREAERLGARLRLDARPGGGLVAAIEVPLA